MIKRAFLLVFGLSVLSLPLTAQQTAEGYVVVGSSESYAHGPGDPIFDNDFLVYKLDLNGNKRWRKNFGGIYWDEAYSVVQTGDGGYVVAGRTWSYTHGDPGDEPDILVYKLNAAGQKTWRKNYGGEYWEAAYSVEQTDDGGYVVSGYTGTYTHGTPGSDGDMILYKLDPSGRKQWRRNYGGVSMEREGYVRRTADGGYILAGSTQTYTHGGDDFLVYKLNASGRKQWRKNYGGIGADTAKDVCQTVDDGFVFAGSSYSYTNGKRDILVYKVDAAGSKEWRKHYGGFDNEDCAVIHQTTDGGYVVSGKTSSYTNDGGQKGDFIVYKLDTAGGKQWRRTYGGAAYEWVAYIRPTADGGYILTGMSASYDHGPGDTDFLVYKIDAAGNVQWRKNYGGALPEVSNDIRQTYQ